MNCFIGCLGRATSIIVHTTAKTRQARKELNVTKLKSSCGITFCLTYRVSQKYPDDFLKMGVASKWVKPRLQNFLCFLSIIMANSSENLVAIALTISLSMSCTLVFKSRRALWGHFLLNNHEKTRHRLKLLSSSKCIK